MNWLNSFDGGKRDFLEKCAREKGRFACLPCHPLQAGKLVTMVQTIQKAAERAAAEAADRAMLDWLGTHGTGANARELADAMRPFARPAVVPKSPAIFQQGDRFVCDGCKDNFNSLPEATSHLITENFHQNATAQLNITSGKDSWRADSRRDGKRSAPQFDATSRPTANTQIPASGTQVEWKPIGRSADSDELRKSFPSSSRFRVSTTALVDGLWPELSAQKRARMVDFGLELFSRGVPGPQVGAALKKFAFLNFGV